MGGFSLLVFAPSKSIYSIGYNGGSTLDPRMAVVASGDRREREQPEAGGEPVSAASPWGAVARCRCYGDGIAVQPAHDGGAASSGRIAAQADLGAEQQPALLHRRHLL